MKSLGSAVTWVAVILGGAVGCAARHGVNVLVAQVARSTTPWATATVNLAGSFVIGALAGLVAAGRLHMSPNVRTFVFVGLLGGFTTFSSFMFDTLTLAQTGRGSLAAANLAFQLAGGVACVWAGYYGALALR